VDNKATIYISNATFSEAHRILRAHPGAEFIVANAILNSAEGRSLAWLGGKDSAIFYYNTLWNGHPEPDPALIKSREQNLSPGEAAERIIPLAINPLPDLHPVFRHSPTDLRWQNLDTSRGRWLDLWAARACGRHSHHRAKAL
jgi:hypothetical protein